MKWSAICWSHLPLSVSSFSVPPTDSVKQSGGRVLVHCQAGISRSATICLAYLMHTQRVKLDEAFDFVKQRRQVISPNLAFMGQLLQFETDVLCQGWRGGKLTWLFFLIKSPASCRRWLGALSGLVRTHVLFVLLKPVHFKSVYFAHSEKSYLCYWHHMDGGSRLLLSGETDNINLWTTVVLSQHVGAAEVISLDILYSREMVPARLVLCSTYVPDLLQGLSYFHTESHSFTFTTTVTWHVFSWDNTVLAT